MGCLPDIHRRVLEWLAEGVDHDAIAGRLGVDRLTVAPLVVVAHRKLERLTSQPSPYSPEENPCTAS